MYAFKINYLDKIILKIIPIMKKEFKKQLYIIVDMCSNMSENKKVYLYVKRVVHSTV